MLCLLVLVLAALAAASAETAAPAVCLGLSGVEPDRIVWFGSEGGVSPLASGWVRITNDDNPILLLEKVAGTTQFNEDLSQGNAWQESLAQQWCEDFYANWWCKGDFAIEKAAILPTTVEETENYYSAAPAPLEGEHVFFLSYLEFGLTIDSHDCAIATDANGQAQVWWLRSPHCRYNYVAYCIGENGSDGVYNVDVSMGARPAFCLDGSAVLLASAAEGGKALPGNDKALPGNGGLSRISVESTREWKLTLLDGNRSFTAQAAEGAKLTQITGYTSWTVPITYEDAQSGDGERISALLCRDGNALYYGQLVSPASSDGMAAVVIPTGLEAGSYTLYLFNEHLNGDKLSDFSSAFSEIALEVMPRYSVTVSGSGSASASPETCTMGDLVALTATPNPGWHFDGWDVISGNVSIAEDSTFVMPDSNVEIRAVFSRPAIAYLDESGATQTVGPESWAEVAGTQWGSGWIAATQDAEISGRVRVTGDVKLILCDDVVLHIPNGITVPSGSSLTIYAQSGKGHMGALTVDDPAESCAGIGGAANTACGMVTIVGGKITSAGSTSSQGGAGIGGGGRQQAGGIVNILGGDVTATATRFSAAIGAGYQGTSANVNISGGTVKATVIGPSSAAIGGGQMASGISACNIVINITGGTITASKEGTNSGAGIGAGSATTSGRLDITITGGTITASSTSVGSLKQPAIGGPSGHPGNLMLGDMAVRATEAQESPVLYAERVSTCRGGTAYLEPCGHSGEVECLWCGKILNAPPFGEADIVLPSELRAIEAEAFTGIAAEVVEIRDGCERIGDRAFRNCAGLKRVRVPASVTDIGADIFAGCGRVIVYGAAGSAAERYCLGRSDCVFVAETAAD